MPEWLFVSRSAAAPKVGPAVIRAATGRKPVPSRRMQGQGIGTKRAGHSPLRQAVRCGKLSAAASCPLRLGLGAVQRDRAGQTRQGMARRRHGGHPDRDQPFRGQSRRDHRIGAHHAKAAAVRNHQFGHRPQSLDMQAQIGAPRLRALATSPRQYHRERRASRRHRYRRGQRHAQ